MPTLPNHLDARHPPEPEVPDGMLRASMQGALSARPRGEPFRLFAYGGLMWQRQLLPGAEARPARLRGFARAWCLADTHMRGTPEAPGLTLGLVPKPGGVCEGVLFTLPEAGLEQALWPGWQQEMRPGWYGTAWVHAVPVPEGAPLAALTFLADAAHPLWVGEAPEAERARVLARASGPSGPAAEYVRKTGDALRVEGLSDPAMETLAARLG
jgi:cation transport protein ChaC